MTTRPIYWAAAVILASLGLVNASVVNAQSTFQSVKLSAGVATGQFGSSVSTNLDVMVSGASRDTGAAAFSGAAYVFRKSGTSWTQQQKLFPADGAGFDEFGASTAIAGNFIIIGAPKDADLGASAGSAYIYRNNGSSWVFQQKLLASDGAANNYFGYSVGISGNDILVGAYGRNDMGLLSGAVYVFRYNGSSWSQTQKLLPSANTAYANFGCSVDVSGTVALVGASNEAGIGAAYLFRSNGSSWSLSQKIVPTDGASGDAFGISVAVSVDHALVGGSNRDNYAMGLGDCGQVYAYKSNGSSFVFLSKLQASDAMSFDKFGAVIDLAGTNIVIGAPGDDASTGSAYRFAFNGSAWTQQQKFISSDRASNDTFGSAVAISDSTVGVGAPFGYSIPGRTGAVYVYPYSATTPPPTACVGDANHNGMVNIDDLVIVISGWNQASGSGDVNGDHITNIDDMVQVISRWGMCP